MHRESIEQQLNDGPRSPGAPGLHAELRRYLAMAQFVLDNIIERAPGLDDQRKDSLITALDAIDALLIDKAKEQLLLALMDPPERPHLYEAPSVERLGEVSRTTGAAIEQRIHKKLASLSR